MANWWLPPGKMTTLELIKGPMQHQYPIFLVILLTLAGMGWLSGPPGHVFLGWAMVTAVIFYLGGLGLARIWSGLRRRRYRYLLGLLGLGLSLGLYGWFLVWFLRPELLPHRLVYDFIAHRRVTERLVDPELFKTEQWDIMDRRHQVLFVHPTSAGNTTLVYPVRVEPYTHLRAHLAVAPEAWSKEGDGVTFSVYVEDEAGIHLLYSRYVDPKHHQQDKRWLPLQVDLSAFAGKLVRIILVTGSGPAGDQRYDWAGWGELRLERPLWP